jgi:hypothetical protein
MKHGVQVQRVHRAPQRERQLLVQLPLNAKRHLAEFVAHVFAVGPRPVHGVAAKAWNEMPVTVVDRLPGGVTVVHDDIKTLGTGGGNDCPSKSGQESADRAGERVGKVCQPGKMCFGHEQSVTLIDRVDVEKCDRFICLDHPGRRNLTADDLAKDAMRVVWYHECAFHPFGSERSRSRTPAPTARKMIRRRLATGFQDDGSSREDRSPSEPRQFATTAGLVGALMASSAPRSAMTAIGAASPWRTLASL